jgi:hypothetical protein
MAVGCWGVCRNGLYQRQWVPAPDSHEGSLDLEEGRIFGMIDEALRKIRDSMRSSLELG